MINLNNTVKCAYQLALDGFSLDSDIEFFFYASDIESVHMASKNNTQWLTKLYFTGEMEVLLLNIISGY